ncbi:hypothetical protein EV401DRAFT_1887450 [Pisolithus croceorrhizus]|nr:hypothetical protein EV401DRAFT_1887450 [Pisolithus croceorrhizus]
MLVLVCHVFIDHLACMLPALSLTHHWHFWHALDLMPADLPRFDFDSSVSMLQSGGFIVGKESVRRNLGGLLLESRSQFDPRGLELPGGESKMNTVKTHPDSPKKSQDNVN